MVDTLLSNYDLSIEQCLPPAVTKPAKFDLVLSKKGGAANLYADEI